ncbi:hypothetical protein D9613_010353 [Agrocybe pediades]|uniref:DUF1917-domain-containing protein n=1 Tax=Agrocybe pediades TaxID=84607 RepID=A0A8H4VHF9_9AGAR|nr:hypothetical protein D9613_010353 [Agrocybe pediades]
MDSEEDVEMALLETTPKKKSPTKKKKKDPGPLKNSNKGNWVAKPSTPEDMGSYWTEETSTAKRLLQFIARWPPSRTPNSYGPWITIYRGTGSKSRESKTEPNIEGLKADFEALLAAKPADATIKQEQLDEIAKANNVLLGKWMVFIEPEKVDLLWGKVAHFLIMDWKKGVAKVSTYREEEKHVIEVFVDDYTNMEEVEAVRKKLKGLGVKWKCGLKPDAYTHLNIYQGNPWNIKPSRYSE